MNTCVRCGISTPENIITKGNTGPLCLGCFNLYCEHPEKWMKFPKLNQAKESYGFLSFTGQTRDGPFWLQILNGRKQQTIREPQSNGRPHVIAGLETNLYWRVRYTREKPVHKIGRAKIVNYEEVRLIDMLFDEENAIADGFQDLDEFRLWFYPDWFNLSPPIQEALRTIGTPIWAGRERIKLIVNNSRGMGKNTLRDSLEKLLVPLRRIKFELIEKNAVPICPRCKGVEYRVEEFSMIRCTKCGEIHYPDELEWTDPRE